VSGYIVTRKRESKFFNYRLGISIFFRVDFIRDLRIIFECNLSFSQDIHLCASNALGFLVLLMEILNSSKKLLF